MTLDEQLEGISSVVLMVRKEPVTESLCATFVAEYTGTILYQYWFSPYLREWPTQLNFHQDAILIIAPGWAETIFGFLDNSVPVYRMTSEGTIILLER